MLSKNPPTLLATVPGIALAADHNPPVLSARDASSTCLITLPSSTPAASAICAVVTLLSTAALITSPGVTPGRLINSAISSVVGAVAASASSSTFCTASAAALSASACCAAAASASACCAATCCAAAASASACCAAACAAITASYCWRASVGLTPKYCAASSGCIFSSLILCTAASGVSPGVSK